MSHSLTDWERVRRYAVPERMIVACTAARERGDWRAACEAARIDVDFEPSLALEAEAVARHFAPDLLRWHLPRALNGRTTLDQARYLLIPDAPVWRGSVLLTAETPRDREGHQRIRLSAVRGAADVTGRTAIPVPAYLWDARHSDRLAVASGVRAAGGTSPLEAFTEAGIEVAPGQEETWSMADERSRLAEVDPWRLAHDARWLAARLWERTWLLWAVHNRFLKIVVDGDTVHVAWQMIFHEEGLPPPLRIGMLRWSADRELVRRGRLAPGSLHPLVRDALFPGTPSAPADVTAGLDDLVRVRCGGVWHEIDVRLGQLGLLAHDPADRQRERALRAFGGEVTGCFAVEQAWHGAPGRLPRRLRDYRADLWQRLVHGGTQTLVDLLDAGLDPHLRESNGGTLIHRLGGFDHRLLLPRLLAAGVDPDIRDKEGNTALHRVIVQHGRADLIVALVDAGADPNVPNREGDTASGYAERSLRHSDRLRHDFRQALRHLLGRPL
ncbi:hypothetical protein Ait01nite_076120 [Actinoplanes italicus]|uniref:Ankyrin repeat protein n=1 Tax=Actinoplanes italicus TaxID=113567 RepID=A0A2T0JYT7_9ACTN|nr:ankyrin repeat domain-containing protein [Actinoplanes italicus]PRX14702.1 ankyrin repeat protein [Actinoplanes italicus]GIE34567.1 hypothetical protein Ait01nite_076120 [Actinoplanes italicus]